MRTLILGLGNPILSDDGVGLFVARKLEGLVPRADVVVTALSGLHLLDLIAGYDRLFLIDALVSQGGAVGDLKKVEAGEGCLHLFSSHGVGFFEVLELGKRLGLKMPEVVAIYGIEIGDEVAFGREYSPQLIHRIESIVQRIREDIESAASTHRVERSIRPDAVDSELSRDPH